MKDRTRESLFNLLGPISSEMHVLDLFAGTGALGLEALSRGAAGAVLIERHRPTANVIRQNVETLGVEDRVQLIVTDVFRWFRQSPTLTSRPWIVFFSPPYDYYTTRWTELQELLQALCAQAPPGSLLAVEADTRFDTAQLPDSFLWRVRDYPPARVAVRSMPGMTDSAEG